MTTNGSFERRLSGWLDETSEHRVPEHLDEVLLQTVATRQRPGWSSPERWLPMTTMVRGRLATGRPSLVLAVVALLLLALAAAAIVAIGRSTEEPIRGYGANGGIFFADGPTLVSVSATGSGRQEVRSLPAGATDLAISPDGTRLAFREVSTAGHLAVLALGPGTTASIPIPGMTQVDRVIRWSPVGDRLAFVASDAQQHDHLMVAAADGSATRSLDLGVQGTPDIWYPAWSPDGAWLAVVVGRHGSANGEIYLVHPDGSDAHRLKSAAVETGDAGTLAWSPDPGAPLLLFIADGRTITTVDVGSGKQRALAGGFWPTWSPSGDRISYWDDGTKVVPALATDPAARTKVEVFPAFTGGCEEHPELARKAFCGPATWSPDGTRLVATDISLTAILSLLADGSGSPIVVELQAAADGPWANVVWQPAKG